MNLTSEQANKLWEILERISAGHHFLLMVDQPGGTEVVTSLPNDQVQAFLAYKLEAMNFEKAESLPIGDSNEPSSPSNN